MATFEETLRDTATRIRITIRQRLLLRWTLANIAGWSLGLFLGSLIAGLTVWVLGAVGAKVLGRMVALLLAGTITGTVAGAAQRWALRGVFDDVEIERRWVLLSAVGGTLGATTLVLTWFTIILGSAGYLLMGGLFGLCFGWSQTPVLGRNFGELAAVWVIANLLGGGLCSLLSLTGVPFSLPIFCTFGPVSFGLITGAVLLRMVRESEL
jgi:hypothetical protein